MTVEKHTSRKNVLSRLNGMEIPKNFMCFATDLHQTEFPLAVNKKDQVKLLDVLLKNKDDCFLELILQKSNFYLDVDVKKGEEGFDYFEINPLINYVTEYLKKNLAVDGEDVKPWVLECIREDKQSYHLHYPIKVSVLALRGMVEGLQPEYRSIDSSVVPHPNSSALLRTIYSPKIVQGKVIAKGLAPYMINGVEITKENTTELMEKPIGKDGLKQKHYFFCNSPELYKTDEEKMKKIEKSISIAVHGGKSSRAKIPKFEVIEDETLDGVIKYIDAKKISVVSIKEEMKEKLPPKKESIKSISSWFLVKSNIYQLFYYIYRSQCMELFELFYQCLDLSMGDSFERIPQTIKPDPSFAITGGYSLYKHFGIDAAVFGTLRKTDLVEIIQGRRQLVEKEGYSYTEFHNEFINRFPLKSGTSTANRFLKLLPGTFFKTSNIVDGAAYYMKQLKIEYNELYDKKAGKNVVEARHCLMHVVVPDKMLETVAVEQMVQDEEDESNGRYNLKSYLDKPGFQVMRTAFDPRAGTNDYNIVNLFTGFTAKKKDKYDQKVIDSYLKFVTYAAQGDQKLVNEIINYFAFILQRPGYKTQRVLFLCGNSGVGKSSFLSFHTEKIIGTKYCLTTSKPDLILGNFNHLIENKLFVNLEEGGRLKYEQYNQLKDIVTRPYVEITQKNKDARDNQKNFMNIAITTNDIGTVKVESDRRLLLVDYPPLDKKILQEFFNNVDDKGADDVYTYLLNVSIPPGWATSNAYQSKSYKKIIRNSAHDFVMFGLNTFAAYMCIADIVCVPDRVLRGLYDIFSTEENKKRKKRAKLFRRSDVEPVEKFDKVLFAAKCGFENRTTITRMGGAGYRYVIIRKEAYEDVLREMYSIGDTGSYLLQRYMYFKYNGDLKIKEQKKLSKDEHDEHEGKKIIRLDELFASYTHFVEKENKSLSIDGYFSFHRYLEDYREAMGEERDQDDMDTSEGFKEYLCKFFGSDENQQKDEGLELIKKMENLKILHTPRDEYTVSDVCTEDEDKMRAEIDKESQKIREEIERGDYSSDEDI